MSGDQGLQICVIEQPWSHWQKKLYTYIFVNYDYKVNTNIDWNDYKNGYQYCSKKKLLIWESISFLSFINLSSW